MACVFLGKHLNRGGKKLIPGSYEAASEIFPLSPSAIKKIWKKHKNSILSPEKQNLDTSRKKGSGRKLKVSEIDFQSRVKNIIFKYRQTLHSLVKQIGMPYETCCHHLHNKLIHNTRNVAKPILTPKIKNSTKRECFWT